MPTLYAAFAGGYTSCMRKSKYTRQVLEPIVRDSFSMGQVLRQLELRPTGGNHRNIVARIRLVDLSTEHFKGQGWSRGETVATNANVARIARLNTWRDDEVFVSNSPVINGPRLIRRLLRQGWIYACRTCGIGQWNGERLSLQLDHLNGVNNDNRLENLQLLCPNCHSQTKTYCRKKNSLSLAR
jgi:formate-dependent nitrite reductase cytochrome c552 subunit